MSQVRSTQVLIPTLSSHEASGGNGAQPMLEEDAPRPLRQETREPTPIRTPCAPCTNVRNGNKPTPTVRPTRTSSHNRRTLSNFRLCTDTIRSVRPLVANRYPIDL